MPHVVRDHVSGSLVALLEQVLDQARMGAVTGAVIGLSLKGRRYHVNVAGALVRDPTFARGIVAALDDELAAIVHGRSQSDTTI